MTSKLKEFYANLEERVRERTLELSSANEKLEAEIAEREQAEGALRKSEEKYRSLTDDVLDSSAVGIFILDSDFKVIWVNQALERYFGVRREDIIGKDKRELIRKRFKDIFEDSEGFVEKVFAAYGNNTYIENFECHVLPGDEREERWLQHWSQPIRSGLYAGGRIEHYTDITERRRVEERLKAANQQLDAGNQQLQESEKQLLKLNHNLEERVKELSCMYGVAGSIQKRQTLGEIFKDTAAMIPPGWQYPDITCARVRFNGKEYITEHFKETQWKQTSDIVVSGKSQGSVEVFYTKECPVLDEGPFLREERNLIDGIARSLGEAAKQKLAEEDQARLLKEVESINNELKDFAYIVSHDLKAPLRGIKTIADWISTDYADKLDEEGREQINLLSSRVDRMHNLIEGILQYSRVARAEQKQVQVNLNELVPKVIDMIAPPENIEIKIEDKLPVAECEETRILQVFQNLLSNAVKYMDKPQGQIRIGCVEEDGFWKFSVSDNGPGIEEKHFERIFKIFQTLSPRDEFESTGVGLTVVKKIIELHGGRIWVVSEIGKGTTFFFTLPKQEMEAKKDAKRKANIAR